MSAHPAARAAQEGRPTTDHPKRQEYAEQARGIHSGSERQPIEAEARAQGLKESEGHAKRWTEKIAEVVHGDSDDAGGEDKKEARTDAADDRRPSGTSDYSEMFDSATGDSSSTPSLLDQAPV
eukprot:jgi/Chlat1/8258/Chrsp78S07697